MKRKAIQTAIEQGQRYQTVHNDYPNRTVVRFLVEPAGSTELNELQELTRRSGIKGASYHRVAGRKADVVEFLLKVFSRDDVRHFAALLTTWVRRRRRCGARRITVLSSTSVMNRRRARPSMRGFLAQIGAAS